MRPSRRHPTHPGKILNEEFLKPFEISPKTFAAKLGNSWTEAEVLEIIEEKKGISDKTAQEFSTVLGTPVDFWIRLEKQFYDWEAAHPNL